jgi:hypothetical protein
VLLAAIFAAMTLIWLVLCSVTITAVGGILQRSTTTALEGAMVQKQEADRARKQERT